MTGNQSSNGRTVRPLTFLSDILPQSRQRVDLFRIQPLDCSHPRRRRQLRIDLRDAALDMGNDARLSGCQQRTKLRMDRRDPAGHRRPMSSVEQLTFGSVDPLQCFAWT